MNKKKKMADDTRSHFKFRYSEHGQYLGMIDVNASEVLLRATFHKTELAPDQSHEPSQE